MLCLAHVRASSLALLLDLLPLSLFVLLLASTEAQHPRSLSLALVASPSLRAMRVRVSSLIGVGSKASQTPLVLRRCSLPWISTTARPLAKDLSARWTILLWYCFGHLCWCGLTCPKRSSLLSSTELLAARAVPLHQMSMVRCLVHVQRAGFFLNFVFPPPSLRDSLAQCVRGQADHVRRVRASVYSEAPRHLGAGGRSSPCALNIYKDEVSYYSLPPLFFLACLNLQLEQSSCIYIRREAQGADLC